MRNTSADTTMSVPYPFNTKYYTTTRGSEKPTVYRKHHSYSHNWRVSVYSYRNECGTAVWLQRPRVDPCSTLPAVQPIIHAII
jgi:hypothetical protein